MNKTEYNNFIKRLIDNLYDVLLHPDATGDCASKLEQVRRSVVEKPEYIFAALNPKSEVDIKFPYILVAVCYALRSLTSKAFLADMPTQNIEKLAGCVTETKKLGAPDYLGFKGINDEVYQKAIEITDMIGLRWDVAVPVFDKRAGEIDAVYKKHQEEQRTRRRYVNNTVEIEELVAVLYPNADKTIEQKIKKFWRAIERASKSNPKIEKWFVVEDGVKKFCRRYYDQLCVSLGIKKVPRASKVCSIEELAITLYPDDAKARKVLASRIQYLRTGAPISLANFAKLSDFFTCGENSPLLFHKGREQEFLEFLEFLYNSTQKTRQVVPENTLTFAELANLVFYDEKDPDKRLGRLYSRKGYVMARLKPERRQEIESWFIQIWGGKCLKKGYYVKYFHLMRPELTIPQEQLDSLGIKNYTESQQGVVDRNPNHFVGVPDSIDTDLSLDDLARLLYPNNSRSYLDKRMCYLLKEDNYPEYKEKMDSWFAKGSKGKKILHKEHFQAFKAFLALPLKSPIPKSPSHMGKEIPAKSVGKGMIGVRALEKYLSILQDMFPDIIKERDEAQKRVDSSYQLVLAAKTNKERARYGNDMLEAARIVTDCKEQIERFEQGNELLQQAQAAEQQVAEIEQKIMDFLHPKAKAK